jgi:hypothetical protein
MLLPAVQITSVRQPQSLATTLLRDFVLHHSPSLHPPRGIDPQFIAYWVPRNVTATAPAKVFARLLHLLLFYEQAAPLPHLASFLAGHESDHTSLCRSLYIVRTLAELGSPAYLTFAADYFAHYLLAHPAAMPAFPLILAAAESLGIDMDPVSRRILAAPPADNYTQSARALLPASLAASQTRRRLLANPDIPELVSLYLQHPSLDIFAARLLRGAAMRDAQPAVLAAFSNALDAAIPAHPQTIHRAAHAIVYLKGKLTFPQEAAGDDVKSPAANFLCDDDR